jgi:NitT/TauT family transport system ATP-binding protein
MRQRVALARALVLQPRLLLLDEPFAALDTVTRARLQDELVALWRLHGWTVVFVTHILAEAVYLADRVMILDRSPVGLRLDRSLDLPRPRNRRDPQLIRIIDHLNCEMGLISEFFSDSCLCEQTGESDAPSINFSPIPPS